MSETTATGTTPLDGLTLDELRRRTSVKWRAYPPDVLPAWVAEMDVTPCPPVVEAVTAAVTGGDTGYGHGDAMARAFAGFADRRWGWAVDPATVRLVPDVMLGVHQVLQLVTDPGDAVVITPPVYPPFWTFVRLAGRVPVEAPLGADGRLDLATLADALARATAGGRRAALLLANPHNPTGAAHTRAELAAVGELAARHRVRVLSDEVHAPLAAPETVVPATTVIPDAICLTSAAKAFNLPGFKAAIAVPGPDAVDDLARLPAEVSHGAGHVAVIAHAAAYTHGDAWLAALNAGIARNRLLFAELLAERVPAARWTPPESTYFAWVDLRGVACDVEPARLLLKQGRLAVNPGPTFGAEGAGHVRVNLATSPEILAEIADRMAAALG